LMALSFWAYAIGIVLLRVRGLILERERQSQWLREWALSGKQNREHA